MTAEHFAWPFFDAGHRALASDLDPWAQRTFGAGSAHADPADACRAAVAALGEAGWLRQCVAAPFGARQRLDARSLCAVRETLAYYDALADFAFAMQGLGSAPISLAGGEEIRQRYLPRVVAGKAIAAFALSETGAGSDVAAIATRAARDQDGDGWRIDGEKTWISNAGIAAFYVVFARSGEAPGAKGLSAFVVDAGTPGLEISAPIETIAPHPLATLRFRGCRVSASRLLGAPGDGFKIAMRSLDIFRTSVAAAALGFARRAFDEALERADAREMFGQRLADFQLTQAALADMAADIDAAALLTYRAAWTGDVANRPTTREAAMAKLVATERGQRVIDRALQMFGALGVTRGSVVERLYREIRALRIYEGASEVQRLIIARQTLAQSRERRARNGDDAP